MTDTRFSVRELIHRPGTQKSVDAVVTAPADLVTPLAQVEEGADVAMHATFESLHEGILATGRLSYRVSAECARCLKPFSWHEEVEFQDLFEYPQDDASEPGAEDETLYVADDGIDLEQPIRDAVVLDLPFRPVCEAYGAGPCEAEGIADADVHARDPRWEALSGLLDEDDDTTDER